MNIVERFVDWFQKECPVCDGTGITVCSCNDQYQITCPECMGRGVIEECVTVQNVVEMPCDNPLCQKGQVACTYCHGSGQQSDGTSCPVCRGKGTIDCPVCHGLGRIERPHQEQWIKHRTCPTCGGKQYVDCPYCHGSKNRVCPQCHGKGKVINKGRAAVVGVLLILLAAMPAIAIAVMGFALAGLVMYLACQLFPPAAAKEETADDGQRESDNQSQQE